MEIPMRRFVFAALAVIVFSACQSANTELTVNQKGEIAAEVELLHGQFLDAWREADVERGMSYYLNSPDITWVSQEGTIVGFEAMHDAAQSMFTNVESQSITITELRTTVLATDVVYQVVRDRGSQTNREGVIGPEGNNIFTYIWVQRNGEWKIQSGHSTVIPSEEQ
jgi:ketosteroid isomerase-like protein